jgi:hypothetical protein
MKKALLLTIIVILTIMVQAQDVQIDKYGWKYDSKEKVYISPADDKYYRIQGTELYRTETSTWETYGTASYRVYNPQTGVYVYYESEEGQPFKPTYLQQFKEGGGTARDIDGYEEVIKDPAYKTFEQPVTTKPPPPADEVKGDKTSFGDPVVVGITPTKPGQKPPTGGIYGPAEKPETKYYYYDSQTRTIGQGTGEPKPGQIVIPDSVVKDAQKYGVANMQQVGVGTTSQLVITFHSKTTKEEGTFEDWRFTTTVTDVVIGTDGKIVNQIIDQRAEVCGEGFDTCKKTGWVEKPEERRIYQSTTMPQTFEEDKKDYTITSSQSYTRFVTKDGKYVDKQGNLVDPKDVAAGKVTVSQLNTIQTALNYKLVEVEDGTPVRQISGVEVKRGDDVVYRLAPDEETVDKRDELKLTDEERKLIDQEVIAARDAYIDSGAAGWDIYSQVPFGTLLGRFMGAYDEYAGLRQYSAIGLDDYEEDVQKRRQKLIQDFCLAAGITNCFTSLICGSIQEIEADNILVGRGPTGQYVSSASLNAERSLPIQLEGLTRQQLIDLFGNSTVIKGRWVNLTDPAFDPKVLGKFKLRLYHVQYSVTNNAEEGRDLSYNIVFARVPEEINSSYGTPVAEAKWWTGQQPVLAYLETTRNDLYKFSATEYDAVCLTFQPGLPSGHAAFSVIARKLCVPFAEYGGGPTDIAAPAGGPAEATQGTTVPQAPGGLI